MSDIVKKKKKKSKKKVKNEVSDSPVDTDSSDEELDLTRECYPMSHYISDRAEMIAQMFSIVKGKKLRSMLPPILKDCDIDKLKLKCLDQLLGMSEKRIQCIIEGEILDSSSESDVPSEESEESDSDSSDSENEEPARKRKIPTSDVESNGKASKVPKAEEEAALPPEQQGKTLLEILELEMRARAIRALLKQGESEVRNQTPQISAEVDLTDEIVVVKQEPMETNENAVTKPPEKNTDPPISSTPENDKVPENIQKENDLHNRLLKKKSYRTREQRMENMEPDVPPEPLNESIEPDIIPVEVTKKEPMEIVIDDPEDGEISDEPPDEDIIKVEVIEANNGENPNDEMVQAIDNGEFVANKNVPNKEFVTQLDLVESETIELVDGLCENIVEMEKIGENPTEQPIREQDSNNLVLGVSTAPRSETATCSNQRISSECENLVSEPIESHQSESSVLHNTVNVEIHKNSNEAESSISETTEETTTEIVNLNPTVSQMVEDSSLEFHLSTVEASVVENLVQESSKEKETDNLTTVVTEKLIDSKQNLTAALNELPTIDLTADEKPVIIKKEPPETITLIEMEDEVNDFVKQILNESKTIGTIEIEKQIEAYIREKRLRKPETIELIDIEEEGEKLSRDPNKSRRIELIELDDDDDDDGVIIIEYDEDISIVETIPPKEPEEKTEPPKEDEPITDNSTWRNRWLSRENMQKAVKSSKICALVRKRLRFKKAAKKASMEEPVSEPVPEAIVEPAPVEQMVIEGSVSEYEKLFGKRVVATEEIVQEVLNDLVGRVNDFVISSNVLDDTIERVVS